MAGTHSLGFLMAHVDPEILGALDFPLVQVFQLFHRHLGHLEGPKSHTRQMCRLKLRIGINLKRLSCQCLNNII